MMKQKINMINSILNIPKTVVETQEAISDEELIKEPDELYIGDVNELFTTKE